MKTFQAGDLIEIDHEANDSRWFYTQTDVKEQLLEEVGPSPWTVSEVEFEGLKVKGAKTGFFPSHFKLVIREPNARNQERLRKRASR